MVDAPGTLDPVQRVVPIEKEIVLIGGGHSHVAVLRSFGMKPIPGVRLTLISTNYDTPYSGMLPGYLAGHYRFEESHINLAPLCQFARAQFYQDDVTGLDPDQREIYCRNHPPVRYDLVSIDIGSTPTMESIPGAAKFAIPVKPVDQFLRRWQEIEQQWTEHDSQPRRVCVVGAGAGGVELTLSLQHRLRKHRSENLQKTHFDLITASPTILPTHNERVRESYAKVLRRRSVTVLTNHRVARVEAKRLYTAGDTTHPFDTLLWVTQAAAPAWPREAGLQVDRHGFIEVNSYLQSRSHPTVFAAGDIAAMSHAPRPKSGVYAVRQGPPLTRNLRNALTGKPLLSYQPQERFLSLISTGDRFAIASRGSWMLQGSWVWRWKDKIDRRFMKRFQDLPAMSNTPARQRIDHPKKQRSSTEFPEIRCTGCGSKTNAGVLSRVLSRLKIEHDDSVAIGLDAPDDAAVLTLPSHGKLVQTVDFFPAFLDDPWLFGRIATIHCLSDVVAMGASPTSAQVVVTLPYALDRPAEETLFQVMSGALKELHQHNAVLIGGHTLESDRLALGMTVNGLPPQDHLLTKQGLVAGDRIILTKALGTGMILAAHMQGKAPSQWLSATIRQMLTCNTSAIPVLRKYQVQSATDVTGFGLIGHLREMLEASALGAEINLNNIPLLAGATDCSRLGIHSSLAPGNRQQSNRITHTGSARSHSAYATLFDPQTSGGLLFGIRAEAAESCLSDLAEAGWTAAREIGHVTTTNSGEPIITINGED